MAKVAAICNRKGKGGRKKAVAAVILEEDYGLAGDTSVDVYAHAGE
jgi:hypothetical protein